MKSIMLSEAMMMCVRAHGDHIDRDGYPRWVHCIRIAFEQDTPEGVVLALLHDTGERKGLQFITDEILPVFGEEMADEVRMLSRPKDMPYLEYIAILVLHGSKRALCVKKGDIEDNTRIERMDARAAAKFPEYKKAHMEICKVLGIQSKFEGEGQGEDD